MNECRRLYIENGMPEAVRTFRMIRRMLASEIPCRVFVDVMKAGPAVSRNIRQRSLMYRARIVRSSDP